MAGQGGIDSGLDTLLDLNGEMFPMENGYWTKFEARKVEPNIHIPHGIKYSLTLHDDQNRRILGYDNAHGIKPERRRFAARRTIWDHKHDREKIEQYEFESAGKLMEDFWNDVHEVLKRETESR